MRDFPADFLWGSSTGAHQVEGGNTNNDWWQWEHTPGSPAVESSGDGVDHWHRFEAEFGLLSALGQNAHRFSMEWSRIEPAEGEFSSAALDHYAKVLESLARQGMTAFATLYHLTLPQWFAARGGWLATDALDIFGRYVQKVATTLGDRIPYACTINEPQLVALASYAVGNFPPGHRSLDEAARVNAVLAEAHRFATEALRAGAGSPKIGTCLQLPLIEPLRADSAEDAAAVAFVRQFMVDFHIDDLRNGGDVGDFVGLQYYTRVLIDATNPQLVATPDENAETTQMHWEIYPEGFGRMLRRVADAGLPIFVTENGIATDDDAQRVRYLIAHLQQVKAALADGVDVRGYMHWSSFDNFEYNHGYTPTFGLIGIDRQNGYRRIVKPSAAVYGEIARSGCLPS
ncbi:MAG: family 1 glycosylhydrolase [Mycobacterium sp.]|nr:family 1 glycosylhydrolase [Mycobacterium sp.]